MSKPESTYEFLTLIIFYQVFAHRIRKTQNMCCFVGCFGSQKKILWPCYHCYCDKYKYKFSWSQFCTKLILMKDCQYFAKAVVTSLKKILQPSTKLFCRLKLLLKKKGCFHSTNCSPRNILVIRFVKINFLEIFF